MKHLSLGVRVPCTSSKISLNKDELEIGNWKLSLFVDFKTQRYSLDKIHDQFNRNYNQINIKNI